MHLVFLVFMSISGAKRRFYALFGNREEITVAGMEKWTWKAAWERSNHARERYQLSINVEQFL